MLKGLNGNVKGCSFAAESLCKATVAKPATKHNSDAAIRNLRQRDMDGFANITPQFTRRGRCNGVVSRETRMRPRSACNVWFGGDCQHDKPSLLGLTNLERLEFTLLEPPR